MSLDTLEHEYFCKPRPGEAEPRIEKYRHEQRDHLDRIIARPLIERCIECGAQTVTGALPSVPRTGNRDLDEGSV